ncbi:YqhA family protein [Thermus amyloliquefaciens]|uniref:YqhA family protein n=1 Tax=Thermus amyloliquefaciens TaxID=1449080 RepID=UPI00056F932D|nr:YqhA family protein [Thermus amyloliquefaciens]
MRPETLVYPLRWLMLLPVAGMLLGALYFAWHALEETLVAVQKPLDEALPLLVGAVDLALLSAVFLIFSLGLFELFIRKLELPLENVLTVESLGDLKGKLGQVIIMILVVKFFEKASAFKPQTSLDFLLFAGGVALLASALWLAKAKE